MEFIFYNLLIPLKIPNSILVLMTRARATSQLWFDAILSNYSGEIEAEMCLHKALIPHRKERKLHILNVPQKVI